ncbi:MAG: bacteriocin [Lachnospiraceae bacterium]|nr:bacteriocin [Lachnospiraceae bacterium]
MSTEKINDDDLQNVSGGLIFNASNIQGADPDKPWEVLDDHTGNNIWINGEKQVFATQKEAEDAAKRIGANTLEISWDEVQRLRGQK